MATTTATGLPLPQWRLVNLIYARATSASTVKLALAHADASVDDLIALESAGLAAVEVAGQRRTLADHPCPQRLIDGRNVKAVTTSGGVDWVVNNPANSTLASVHGLNRGRGARLTEVLRDSPNSIESINEVRDLRLVAAMDADGELARERVISRAYRVAAHGAGDEVWLKLTARGRALRYPHT